MNRNDFTGFINGSIRAGEADIPGIRELINLYPWFHSAHLVLLKALKESSDVRFDSQLHESAIYVADRSMLYSYLYVAEPKVQKPEPAVPSESVTEPENITVPPDAENLSSATESAPLDEAQLKTTESQAEKDIPGEPETMAKNEITEPVPGNENDHVISETDFSTRTREDLISEIEARLRELAGVVVQTDTDQRPAEPIAENKSGDAGQLLKSPAPEDIAALQEANILTEQPQVLEIVPETVLEEESHIEMEEPVKVADDDLLELAGDDFSEADEEYVIDVNALKSSEQEGLTQSDLIDRFIETSPRIQRMEPSKDENVVDLSVDSVETKNTFITETLARIYISQGYYSKAINIYEKLALQYPEKSAYFASRIEKIKDLIK